MSIKKAKTSNVDAISFFEKRNHGQLALGQLLEAIRLGEDMTQPAFARKLGISKSSLNDIEKGRKLVSPERAARYAKILGYLPEQFVELSIADQLRRYGMKMIVEIKAA